MASAPIQSSLERGIDVGTAPFLPGQITTICAITITAIIASSWLASWNRSKNRFPIANPPGSFQSGHSKRMEFMRNGMCILSKSRELFKGKPFRLLTELDEIIVLPQQYANLIRNETSLSFSAAIARDFNAHLPGFEPFGILQDERQHIQTVARKQLTKYLNTVTKPLSSEATFATHHIFGESSEWQEVVLKDVILDLIARLSSRVFLGEKLCRNEAWLKITKQYTVDSFKAVAILTAFPSFLRRIVSWFLPACKTVRDELEQARKVIKPILEERGRIKAQARADGKPIPSFNDAIDWAEAESQGQPYDDAIFQLVLSFAAIHTTTDLLSHTLVLLSDKPEYIEALRAEMIEVLTVSGWKKSSLYNLRLLDSTLKEAQRIKPTGMLPMRRLAINDVTLENGVRIHKGERCAVDGYAFSDPTLYENPGEYDIYRFLRMREQPGMENKAQLVATGDHHLAFGHGMHACPGRFFAANEIKLALCHLLLKYDWKLAPGSTVNPIVFATAQSINPATRVLYRRRKEEIDLKDLSFD
ncbi:cytochrome P450 [Aspergillus granulosus]|uniref:Cytochrome P450 n=1 Tax=Aspergillus granulosus TaxID=176169 RepID=A0ABR4HJT5_9EURO